MLLSHSLFPPCAETATFLFSYPFNSSHMAFSVPFVLISLCCQLCLLYDCVFLSCLSVFCKCPFLYLFIVIELFFFFHEHCCMNKLFCMYSFFIRCTGNCQKKECSCNNTQENTIKKKGREIKEPHREGIRKDK